MKNKFDLIKSSELSKKKKNCDTFFNDIFPKYTLPLKSLVTVRYFFIFMFFERSHFYMLYFKKYFSPVKDKASFSASLLLSSMSHDNLVLRKQFLLLSMLKLM